MELQELMHRFRVEANDKVEPYFTDDEDLKDWLNDAVTEACIRARLLHESQDEDLCLIPVTAGNAVYPLHECMYELTHLFYDPLNGRRGQTITLKSEEALSNIYHGGNWRTLIGAPEYAVQSDTGLRLVPKPIDGGELRIEGYRLPIKPMVDPVDKPEIHKGNHVDLVQWALHKAFSVPDTEFFDQNRADIAEAKFIRKFGLPVDADMRRDVREDELQLNYLSPIV